MVEIDTYKENIYMDISNAILIIHTSGLNKLLVKYFSNLDYSDIKRI